MCVCKLGVCGEGGGGRGWLLDLARWGRQLIYGNSVHISLSFHKSPYLYQFLFVCITVRGWVGGTDDRFNYMNKVFIHFDIFYMEDLD